MYKPTRSSVVTACVIFLLSTAVGSAQDYAVFDGAWIHAEFIQSLKKTSSVPTAMEQVGAGDPFWIEIDSTNDEGIVRLSFGFGESEEFVLRRTQLHGSDLRWVIGSAEAPKWVLTIDQRSASYIALYDVGDLGGQPIVLGRLPAERQEADFLLERIINAAVLYGAYRDKDDNRYQFSTDMTSEWKGARVPTHVDVDPTSNEVILTVTMSSGKMLTYKAERIGSALKLTDSSGTVLALTAE